MLIKTERKNSDFKILNVGVTWRRIILFTDNRLKDTQML